jgi:hypothetical protein
MSSCSCPVQDTLDVLYRDTKHPIPKTLTQRSIILLAVGFATPIFLTSLGYLPYMTRLQDALEPRLTWPSLIGTYHVRALPFFLGSVPTRGQTWYIVLMTVLTVVLTAVGYKSSQPSAYFPTSWREIMVYVGNRAAVHAVALLPLVLLFAGRNNLLLHLTNWRHSTFVLLHRWLARLFGLQILVHAIVELLIAREKHTLATEQQEAYWRWGIGGVFAIVLLLVASALPFRRRAYDAFLVLHIVLALLLLVAAWFHLDLLYAGKWGYQYWLYAAFAVWAADRGARVLRVLKNGTHRARISLIGDGIVRIDVPGVQWDARQPGRHVYAFFPGLHRTRPWENHPFSVVPTALLDGRDGEGDVETEASSSPTSPLSPTSDADVEILDIDIEKAPDAKTLTTKTMMTTITTSSPVSHPPARRRSPSTSTPSTNRGTGITLFIRPGTGSTRHLLSHLSAPTAQTSHQPTLLTHLDGPYSSSTHTPTFTPSTDRLLLLAGGLGITAVLPYLPTHPHAALHWGVRASAQGLVDAIQPALSSPHLPGSRERGRGGGGEVHLYMGTRMSVRDILARESAGGWRRVRVVVCGPAGLSDEVRSEVARCARSEGTTKWELEVEAFGW